MSKQPTPRVDLELAIDHEKREDGERRAVRVRVRCATPPDEHVQRRVSVRIHQTRICSLRDKPLEVGKLKSSRAAKREEKREVPAALISSLSKRDGVAGGES